MLATLEGLGSGGVVAVRKRSPENTINDIIVIPGLRPLPSIPRAPPPPDRDRPADQKTRLPLSKTSPALPQFPSPVTGLPYALPKCNVPITPQYQD